MWYDTSHYLANKILASQNNFGMAVSPDPFSKGLARARLLLGGDASSVLLGGDASSMLLEITLLIHFVAQYRPKLK